MRLQVKGQTDVGVKRESNQDSFLVDDELGLYVVADGMGGHLGGEVASRIAVLTIKSQVRDQYQADPNANPKEVLIKAYAAASQAIYEKSEKEMSLKGMGTTAVSALFRDGTLYIANVGDSRSYLIHPPYIWQMTEDHSLLNEQIKAGLVKPEQARSFVARNVITRSVGFERQVTADVYERVVEPGEFVLLCSDGLTGLLTDGRICDLCLTLPFNEIVPRLIEEAKRNGGDDNITAILMQAAND